MKKGPAVKTIMGKGLKLSLVLTLAIGLPIFCAVSSFASAGPLPPAVKLPAIDTITKNDRILILSPHPDDEAIACAGIIQKAVKAGADLHVVFLTNGDSNQLSFIVFEKRLVFMRGEYLHMGEVRRKESIKAMQVLGLPAERLVFLGYPDFGTMAIFRNYWNVDKPFKSLLTRVSSVPYKEDFSFGKPYIGESILFDLEEVIRRYKPTKIFVSHAADVNSDHRALYLFSQVALWDLQGQLNPHLQIYSYLVHHRGWPLPRHFHPELNLLPPQDMQDANIKWQSSGLDSAELKKKQEAILAYHSQTTSSAFYLLSFARKNELFGAFGNIALRDVGKVDQIVWTEHPDILWEKEEREWIEESAPSAGGSQLDYALKDGNLYIKIVLKKQPLIKDLTFYLFGYKDSVAFRDMPKIRLKIIGETIRLSDKTAQLKTGDIYFHNGGKTVIVGVPLKILNDPQSILAGVYASSRGISSEAAAWRIVELK